MLILGLEACGGGRANPVKHASGTVAAPPAAGSVSSEGIPSAESQVVNALLTTMRTEGYHADPAINHGLGGLYVNWRYNTTPLEANIVSGDSPTVASTNAHDPLTDLRYLHDLWIYKSEHPDNGSVDAEISRYTPIVKTEFSGIHDQRGWLFDELIDLYRLSSDRAYQSAAFALDEYIATSEFHPATGGIYQVDTSFPTGYYRTDLALTSACALIQGGVDFGRPDWTTDGWKALAFVYAHAYLPRYDSYLMAMTNVVLPDGAANPQEAVDRHRYRHEEINGGVVRIAELGEVALSLLHASVATASSALLADAEHVLDGLTASDNATELWDRTHGGYFAGLVFPGSTNTSPGTPTVQSSYKEVGRQPMILQAFHLADSILSVQGRYRAMEQSMLTLIEQKIFYTPGQGVLYEMTPDFQPVHPGWTWVTSEAIDITLEALLSTDRSSPW